MKNPYFSFFFNDPSTTEIYTLSLLDALPISVGNHLPLLLAVQEVVLALHVDERRPAVRTRGVVHLGKLPRVHGRGAQIARSEEHTSELQSRLHLVCRLLLEKK